MTYLKISSIIFRASNLPFSGPLEVPLKNITLLVGPNNSGKSQTLRDILKWSQSKREAESGMVVLSQISNLELPSNDEDIDALLTVYKVQNPPGQITDEKQIHVSVPDFSVTASEPGPLKYPFDKYRFRGVIKAGYQNIIKKSPQDLEQLDLLTRMYTINLDATTRFNLVNNRQSGDLLQDPINFLANLFHHDEDVQRIDEITSKVFRLHFYLDVTGAGYLRIRMTRENWEKRKSLDRGTLEFFSRTPHISEYSDGVKAFMGIILAAFSLPHKIMLIDDPEAFLHPNTAQSLGRLLSSIIKERDASLFVSTHSADFMIGCLEAAEEITIIRLTYDIENATATELSSGDINYIMRDPLLRSTDILSALFHHSAVICEGDMDRVSIRRSTEDWDLLIIDILLRIPYSLMVKARIPCIK